MLELVFPHKYEMNESTRNRCFVIDSSGATPMHQIGVIHLFRFLRVTRCFIDCQAQSTLENENMY